MSPEKMPTISGADRFSRRGGHLPTTRDIYEPIVYHLEIAGGIVKHGSAIGRVLKRTGGPYFFIEEKRRMTCPYSKLRKPKKSWSFSGIQSFE
jgi:hypothetical protein